MAYIGDYFGSYNSDVNSIAVFVRADSKLKTTVEKIPSVQEWNDACEVQGAKLRLSNTFSSCVNLIGAPALPDDLELINNTFSNCSSLIIPPKLPRVISDSSQGNIFYKCSSLLIPATIPDGLRDIYSMYEYCSSLRMPASIPSSATSISNLYRGCAELSGEFCIRTNLTSYRISRMLEDTVKPITIYGDQTVCEAVAATANNGNASWQPWYDPVPAVTDRGQGSYTTAEDMTRMVRNGCLAVDSYAPGRMVYNQGDIVREDEWTALVEAAQTIDPTVTMSTHYTNLNKIEKAFDDAL